MKGVLLTYGNKQSDDVVMEQCHVEVLKAWNIIEKPGDGGWGEFTSFTKVLQKHL